MARRKRLTPAQPEYLGQTPPSEAQSVLGLTARSSAPPIAQVAGDAASAAALQELAEEMRCAAKDGRLVQSLPLDAIVVDHLVRDRVAVDEVELEALVQSIAARGQQTPIEVVALDDASYGLISGWRRIVALKRLSERTGEPRFAKVQALLRRPENASDAYLAMVEENEIRVGLSYYERARIAARAAEQGVFSDDQAALRALFASASRAKRSKIGAFVQIYRALDGGLRFPAAIPDRLGLKLSKALSEDARLGTLLTERLRKAAPETADAEQRLLVRAIKEPESSKEAPRARQSGKVTVQDAPDGLLLSGPGVDATFRTKLERWLKRSA